MSQKDPENGPSLELPSLFGRRKQRDPRPEARHETPPEAETRAGAVDTAERTQVIEQPPVAHTPAVTPTAVPTPTPAPAETTAPRSRPWQHGSSTVDVAERRPKAAGGRRARTSGRRLPDMAASTAVILVGALIGLAGCVLTFLGLQGCELVTGTDSCGGPGLLVLVVILVAMVLLGGVVLRALRVAEAGNISFLGVGIMTVVALTFFADQLYAPWMFLVVPLVTASSFGVAHWITTRYAEDVLEDHDDRPHYDVR